MQQYGTVTSKNQITIPAKIARKLNLKAGEKVSIAENKGEIVITPAVALVEKLAGSIKVPKHLKGRDIDELIEEAKEKYFAEKYAYLKKK